MICFLNFSPLKNLRFLMVVAILLFSFIAKSQEAQPLSKELLEKLSTQLIVLKEKNQYLNAELLKIFVTKGNGNYIQVKREIENINTDISNQKLLFNYWYNKYKGDYLFLADYLNRNIFLSKADAKYLAMYIENLTYLNGVEKREIKEEESLLKNQYDLEQKLQGQIYDLKIAHTVLYSKLSSGLIDSIFTRLLSFEKGEKKAFLNNKSYQYNAPFILDLKMSLQLLPNYFEIKIDSGKVKHYSPEYYILNRAIPFDKSPKITIQNVSVETNANFNNIIINVSGGYCLVNKTKRGVDFVFQQPKSEAVRKAITNKLIGVDQGRYEILYRIGSVNDKQGENIEFRRD